MKHIEKLMLQDHDEYHEVRIIGKFIYFFAQNAETQKIEYYNDQQRSGGSPKIFMNSGKSRIPLLTRILKKSGREEK